MKKVLAIIIMLSLIPMFNIGKAQVNEIYNEIYGVAVDSHGDVIVTGQYKSGENYLIRTQKYDGSNGHLKWSRDFSEPNVKLNVGKAVVVDSNDNIYVGGIVGVGNYFLKNGFPKTDYIIIKYDENGNKLWTKTYDKHFADFMTDMAIDSNGNIYATGMTFTFDLSSQTLTNVNFWTIKVNGITSSLITEDEYDKEKLDAAFGIDVRGNDVFVVGSIGQDNASKYTVIKYDKNLNRQPGWPKFYGNDATASDVAILSNGNIAVAGNKNEDFWTLMLNNNGNEIWNRTDGKAKTDYTLGIALDSNENIVIGNHETSGGIEKWHVVKYSPNGQQLLDKNLGIDGEIKKIATYGNYIIAAGYKSVNGEEHYCVAKFDSNGNKIWEGTGGEVATVKADFGYTPANPTRADIIHFTDLSTGTIVNYTWKFGDGIKSHEKSPTHQYKNLGTYTVTLTVSGPGGSDSKSAQITIKNSIPTASFDYNPLNPLVNEEMTFDGSNSKDLDGSITNYTWQFGDGSIGYGGIVKHSYSKNGSYTVSLTVVDNDGASKSTSKIITVNNATNNSPPVAAFDFEPTEPKIGSVITFNASASYDKDGTIVLYRWDWNGDGKYDKETTQPVVSHSWENEGEYTVVLQVEDNGSMTNTYSKVVNVVASNIVSNFIISAPDKIDVKKGEEKIIEITVKNGMADDITGVNIVAGNLDGIKIDAKEKNITLHPNEKKQIQVGIKANESGKIWLRAVGNEGGNEVRSGKAIIDINLVKNTPSFTFIMAFISLLAVVALFKKWKK